MKLQYSAKTAIDGLTTHKSRSALTILGVVIGITSIILVMSLGQGAQNLILSQVNGLGATTIAIIPGKVPTGPSSVAQILSDSLKDKDLFALENKTNVPYAKYIMPMVMSGGDAVYGSQTYQAGIFGGGTLMTRILNISVAEGDFFTDDDVLSKAQVVVIGHKVKDQLFDGNEAIGQKIRIRNNTFKVIGVLPEKGQSSFVDFDEAIIMPYTTVQQYVLGIKYFNRIIVQADSQDHINATADDIRNTLRNSHNITNPANDDFSVTTQADIAATLNTVTTALTAFLAAVAAISLVVGGIGIMNIMLVSVTERTREIGLRKAIGATDKDILMQFLFEAVILTATGGFIGVILGGALSYVVSIILTSTLGLNWQFVFPWDAAILGIAVAGLVGLVFGIYPASQAAKKSPMEALRYE
jgi:putative ABC transport system permease protein